MLAGRSPYGKLNTLARVLVGTPRVAASVLRAARALRGQDHLAKGQPFIAVQAPKDMRPRRGCSCYDLALPIRYVWAGELIRRFQLAVLLVAGHCYLFRGLYS